MKENSTLFYFQLTIDASDREAQVVATRDNAGFDEYRFYKGQWIEDWPEGVTFFVVGRNRQDYLAGALHWTIVSDRVREVLETCHVRGVQYLKAQVRHSDTRESFNDYWVLNITRLIEALDWEHTRWFHPERAKTDAYPLMDMIRPAFKKELVRGVDVFRLRVKGLTGEIFVSPRVKLKLEAAEATKGLGFDPIPLY